MGDQQPFTSVNSIFFSKEIFYHVITLVSCLHSQYT